MPSLRKKVTEFLRQLSANNNVHFDPETSVIKDEKSGCFIQRYLNGEHKGGLGSAQDADRGGPAVFHGGRDGADLPNLRLQTPHPDIFAAYTGPDGGLTTVNRGGIHSSDGSTSRQGLERHLSTDDPDVDFIDNGKEEGVSTEPKILQKPAKCSLATGTAVNLMEVSEIIDKKIAGIPGGWDRWNRRAYGMARSLYERHPVSGRVAGSPVADAFAVVARKDSALLALADGVNWGPKAATAARAALHGSLRHLHVALYNPPASIIGVKDTKAVFVAILRSFHEAHSMILQEEGMLTTLTVAAVLPIAYGEGKEENIVMWDTDVGIKRWAVCVVNVGDSLAYVYNKIHGVREITMGSHDINCMRDMRDALGALGPAEGQNPELNNLTCSLTIACPGDVVFLTSDGVSDNFDPVVGKFAVPKVDQPTSVGVASSYKAMEGRMESTKRGSKVGVGGSSSHGETSFPTSKSTGNVAGETGPGRPKLPVVEAHQRHALTLLRMEDLLVNGVSGEGAPDQGLDAVELCHRLVEFATRLTAAKRHILEDPELYIDEGEGSSSAPLGRAEQRGRRRKVCEKLSAVPGKLDHASVVAYVVGEFMIEEKVGTLKVDVIEEEVKLERKKTSDNKGKIIAISSCKETLQKQPIQKEVSEREEYSAAFEPASKIVEGKNRQDMGEGNEDDVNGWSSSSSKVEEVTDAKKPALAELFETGL